MKNIVYNSKKYMEGKMDYKILLSMAAEYEDEAARDLEKRVEMHIRDGWKPIGGVSFTTRKNKVTKMMLITMSQVRIKEEALEE